VTVALKWNEVIVGTWQEFIDALEPMLNSYRVPPTYLFRGQADASWPLEPSLLRRMRGVTDRAFAHEIEQLLEKEFIAQAFLFPEVRGVWSVLFAAPRPERWTYMQHHSCPTRLLDWTASAFVAAYFAVEQSPHSDGAVFVVAPAALSQCIETGETIDEQIPYEAFTDPRVPDRVTFAGPALSSSRSAAQQGHFSVCTNILATHDDAILRSCSAAGVRQPESIIYRKIVIASQLKLVVLQQLRAMNVAPHALFPTVDGLGRSLADLATLKVALANPRGMG
jgi:hypothetical protein